MVFDPECIGALGSRLSPRVNRIRSLGQILPRTSESDALSKDLKKRGFRFVGSTICYAFMQAVGLVNDHLTTCFRYRELLAEPAGGRHLRGRQR